jgi:hypothetical protein
MQAIELQGPAGADELARAGTVLLSANCSGSAAARRRKGFCLSTREESVNSLSVPVQVMPTGGAAKPPPSNRRRFASMPCASRLSCAVQAVLAAHAFGVDRHVAQQRFPVGRSSPGQAQLARQLALTAFAEASGERQPAQLSEAR